MTTRGLVVLLLAVGLILPLPFAVGADEELTADLIEVAEEVIEPIVTPITLETPPEPEVPFVDPIPEPEVPVDSIEEVSLFEVSSAPEESEIAAFSTFSDEEEEETPELIWGCDVFTDENGEEFEQCGMGYYRELCYVAAGEEICITFFEFYEEEEVIDYFQEELDELFEYERLNLSLAWNGVPFSDEVTIPFNTPGTLSWNYVLSEDYISEYGESAQNVKELLTVADISLQIYKGPIGAGVLLVNQDITGNSSGEIPITLTEENEYRIFITATLTEDGPLPPGWCVGGDLCNVPSPRIESFNWFIQNGLSCIVGDDEEPADFCIDENGDSLKPKGSKNPLVFGVEELVIGTDPVGISNVLFLPGIKGSRLYRPSQTCDPDLSLECPKVRLWDPPARTLLENLYLLPNGRSSYTDIYTEEGNIVDEVLGTNFYASFVNQMNALKADGTITDWRAAAYDWRLSLDDIIESGKQIGNRIYFHEEVDTPYIEGTLKELAASSPTGKVSIIAHSNGGLVTKRLLQKLEAQNESHLVDKIIFVGVPQSGAPQAMAGLLYGYGEALPFDNCSEGTFTGWLCAFFSSRDIARKLAEHSPMAYHLLPSEAYFEQVSDTVHPVAKFNAQHVYQEERTQYGESVNSVQELYDFLVAADGGRVKPATDDTANANVLNSSLISYGQAIHESLDSWTPPAHIQVYQIAGWGMNTIAGIEFYEQQKLFGGYKEMYRPIFVEDGDGVVPIPSALQLSEGLGNVENFWINLQEAGRGNAPNRMHGDLLELEEARIFIRNLLIGNVVDLPNFISSTRPAHSVGEKLIFFLHSPLTLELEDKNGNGLDESNGVEYGEFGEVKYAIAPSGEYEVVLRGQAVGTFSLDIQKFDGIEITSSATIADVPSTENTFVTMSVGEDLNELGMLRVDENGDGEIDIELEAQIDSTVIYEPVEDIGEEDTEESDQETESTSRSGSSVARESLIAVNNPIVSVPTYTEERQILPTQTHEVAAYTRTTENLAAPSNPHVNTEAEKLNRLSKPAERSALTASAYEAIDFSFFSKVGEVLYNFIKSLGQMIAEIFK